MRKIIIFISIFTLAICLNRVVAAQGAELKIFGDTCEGVIYKSSQLIRRAVLITRPKALLTDEARDNHVRGQVKLKAVLCRSGKVTNIQVIEGLPFGVTERAVESVRKINFKPAQLGGQTVSQELNFEFNFSYLGDERPLARGQLEGRIIESVLVEGFDSGKNGEIKKEMDFLIGQVYQKSLIEKVRQRLLKIEDFDPNTSTVRIEEGKTGGLSIVYLMQKRPEN